MGNLTYNEFQLINMGLILTDNNARKKFDPVELQELSDSVKRVGLINPITVARAEQDGKYVLIAGERRFKACKMAGWVDIPAIIAEGEPNRLKEIQLVENCQRKDMNPIEELDAFMGLIALGYEPENIAQQIGKSIKYVITRLNLIKLTDRAKKLLYDDNLNLAQSRYLVLMTEELQEKALDELTYIDGVGVVQFLPAKNFYDYFIKNQTYELAGAKFDPKDAKLYKDAGACTKCKFNSTVNTTLFSDISLASLCSKPDCFIKKTEYTIQKHIAEWQEKGLEVVEACQYHSEIYPSEYQYSRVPQEELDKKNFVVETMLIVVEGYGNLGNYYPVYSKAQLKAIQKANETANQENNTAKQQRKAQGAIKRFSELVVSRISENYVQQDNLFTPGIHLLAIYQLYTELDLPMRGQFLKAVSKDISIEGNNYQAYEKAFFDNIGLIEENLEKSFAIASLMNLSPMYVYADSVENVFIQKLAMETGINIEDCRNEIADESGVDLSNV